MKTSLPISVEFLFAIEVARDRARADIRIGADGCIANVREMSHLDAFAEIQILHFTEVAH